MTVLRLLAQFAVLSFLVLPWFSDPSIVNNLASRTLGQIRVRFTKFRHWPTRWKTQLAQRIFCVRNFKWKFGSFPCSYYFLFSYLSLKYVPPMICFIFPAFLLFGELLVPFGHSFAALSCLFPIVRFQIKHFKSSASNTVEFCAPSTADHLGSIQFRSSKPS